MIIVIHDTPKEWRDLIFDDIKPDMYIISSYGEIVNKKTGKELKPPVDEDGYLRIELSTVTPHGTRMCKGTRIARRAKKYFVHRLVSATYNDDFDPELVINHRDSNRKHNYFKNLEATTDEGNREHGILHGFIDYSDYEMFSHSKYSDKLLHEICEHIQDGYSTRDTILSIETDEVASYRVFKSLVNDIKSKRSHTNISKNYNF